MILVDTSIWIDHLRQGDVELSARLNACQVLAHPFVIGELALGSLKNRDAILAALRGLPQAQIATDEEVMGFISQEELYGLGIGYIDAHLLAAVRLTPDSTLWTRDKRLLSVASRLGIAANLAH